jgi:hypothetical protein
MNLGHVDGRFSLSAKGMFFKATQELPRDSNCSRSESENWSSKSVSKRRERDVHFGVEGGK